MRRLGHPLWGELKQGVCERAVLMAEGAARMLMSVSEKLDLLSALAERDVAAELFETARVGEGMEFDGAQRTELTLVYAREFTKTLLVEWNAGTGREAALAPDSVERIGDAIVAIAVVQ